MSRRPRPARPAGTALLLAIFLPVSGPEAHGPAAPPPPTDPDADAIFRDASAEAGLDFVHFNGMSGRYYFSEIMGAGAALLDYDGDGDLDLYLVQGRMLGGVPVAEATFPPRGPLPPSDRLLRNDAGLRLVDVTAASGVRATGYGMGVATGDVDNDGAVDLYVTNFGENQLLHNNGDGTFTDITAEAGAGDGRWSVPAVFFDYDADGWLDLFVGNYSRYSLAVHRLCPNLRGEPDYCGPQAFPPAGNRLLHNRGDGTFEDVTARALPGASDRTTLGAISGDFDGDGRLDLYVANDAMPNVLWLNNGDGTFRDEALLAGCASNGEGRFEASMGLAAGDIDDNGAEDLFMTHVVEQTNTLYLNAGAALFRDRSRASGLARPSWARTGFGATFIDFDNDGALDVATVNGAVNVLEPLRRSGDPFPLHQPNQLFRNLGGARFSDVSGRAGSGFRRSEVSRGLVLGDVDNDGDGDLLLTNNSGPARLLLDRTGQQRAWLGLRLVRGRAARDALGALAVVGTRAGRSLARRARTGGSYASAGDPRLLVGLGDEDGPVELQVTWPSGQRRRWRELAPRRYYVIPDRRSGPAR